MKPRLVYVFRVHNEKEDAKILQYLKNLNIRFAINNYDDEWEEFTNAGDILNYPKLYRNRPKDYMIRVYFCSDARRAQVKRKIKEIIGPIICGNQDCSSEWCPYHILNRNHPKDAQIEYLWRCILNDDGINTTNDFGA